MILNAFIFWKLDIFMQVWSVLYEIKHLKKRYIHITTILYGIVFTNFAFSKFLLLITTILGETVFKNIF